MRSPEVPAVAGGAPPVSNAMHGFSARLASSMHSGNCLTKSQVSEQRNVGTSGVLSMGSRLAPSTAPTVGIELEFVVTDFEFNPAPEQGYALLQYLKSLSREQLEKQFGATVTGELFRYQQEINPIPRLAAGDSYHHYEQGIRKYLTFVNKIAKEQFGCQVLMHGILPTQMPQHVVDASLGDNPRYPGLVSGVETARAMRDDLPPCPSATVVANTYGAVGPTYNTKVQIVRQKAADGQAEWSAVVLFDDAVTGETRRFSLNNTSVLLAGVMTSMQSHLALPRQDKYVGYHRAADLVTPLITALTVGEPLLFMEQAGAKGLRNFLIWQAATDPNRVGYTMLNWLDTPLGQFADAQRFGPIFGRSAGKLSAQCSFSGEEAVAIETAKTVWNFNRTTVDVVNDQLHLRIENRVAPCGPTVTDTMADVVVSNALIRMGHNILEKALGDKTDPSKATIQEMESYMAFDHVKANMRNACVAGLEAQVLWTTPGEAPKHRSVLELLRSEFLPGFVDSLCSANPDFDNEVLNRDDVEHYMGVIEDRLNFKWNEIRDIPESWKNKVGCTSADVILYLDHTLKPDFENDIARAQQIVALLQDAVSFDEAAFALSEEQTGRGRGRPITAWMRDRFGKEN